MTTNSLTIPTTAHRAEVVLGIAAAALVALGITVPWAFFPIAALAIVVLSAAENETFLLVMIFLLPFQWRLGTGLPVASAVRVLMVLGFFIGRLWRWRVGARELLQQPLSRASLYFLAAGAASLIFGKPGWMEGAPEGIARLASYVGFYFLILSWVNTEERLRRAVGVIMVSAIVLAAFALFQESIGDYTSLWIRLNPGVLSIST